MKGKKMRFVMPTRTLEYLLMGIIAGIIAGVIMFYVFGVTYFELMRAAEGIRLAFKTP